MGLRITTDGRELMFMTPIARLVIDMKGIGVEEVNDTLVLNYERGDSHVEIGVTVDQNRIDNGSDSA